MPADVPERAGEKASDHQPQTVRFEESPRPHSILFRLGSEHRTNARNSSGLCKRVMRKSPDPANSLALSSCYFAVMSAVGMSDNVYSVMSKRASEWATS